MATIDGHGQNFPPGTSTADPALIQQHIAELPQTGTPPILQQIINLVLGFLAGVGGKVSFKIPDEQLTESFSAFGKTWTFTLGLHNGHIQLSLTPQ